MRLGTSREFLAGKACDHGNSAVVNNAIVNDGRIAIGEWVSATFRSRPSFGRSPSPDRDAAGRQGGQGTGRSDNTGSSLGRRLVGGLRAAAGASCRRRVPRHLGEVSRTSGCRSRAWGFPFLRATVVRRSNLGLDRSHPSLGYLFLQLPGGRKVNYNYYDVTTYKESGRLAHVPGTNAFFYAPNHGAPIPGVVPAGWVEIYYPAFSVKD